MSPRKPSALLVLPSLVLSLTVLPASGHDPEDAITPDPLAFVSPSRSFETLHTRLDLDVDLEKQTIAGSVTHRMKSLRSGVTEIRLNAVDLTIESVTLDGHEAVFDYPVPSDQSTSWFQTVAVSNAGDQLVIQTGRPLSRGDEFTVTVHYHGSPEMGLYWIAPEKGIPEKRYEVWSQGEGEDNRYWFPAYDYPNDTFTYEGTFRVAEGYYALSNGALVETNDLGGRTEYVWRLEQPVVNYLITLAAAEYVVFEDEADGLPLLYVVPPGTDEETVQRGYGRTPDMMRFFNRTIGIDYPYAKYAQVSVQNFIWGGMENASATTMNMRTLFDERAGLTRNEDGLVAHELAHQWWGDLVTCREWSHMWLNEGFATYYQSLYRQEAEGDDAFRYQIWERNRRTVKGEDRDPRPVVTDFFNRRDARNSNNVYNKGGVVLHMLRFLLGDELYHATIKHYAEEHLHGVVETADLMRAVKDVTGENLDWFFEQWLYLVGHPKFQVAKTWDEGERRLHLNVRQTQEVTRLWPVFRVPLDIEITTEEGAETYRVVIDRADQDFYFTLPSEPKMVIFDKGDWILKTLDFPKSAGELAYQLEHGDYMARVRAAVDLGKKGSRPETVPALRKALLAEGHWGLPREAALALGRVRTDEAREVLFEGLRLDAARVRMASAEALGEFQGDETAAAELVKLLESDVAWGVREKAVASLVTIKSKKAKSACRTAIAQESYRSVVRNAGLNGLVTLEDIEALGLVRGYATAGNDREHRHTAITAYAKLARLLENDRDRVQAAKFLSGMLDDWFLNTRKTVISALGTLGEKSAVADLRYVENHDPLESLRARAGETATKLESSTGESEELEATRARVTELERKLEKLTQELEELKRKAAESPDKTASGVD